MKRLLLIVIATICSIAVYAADYENIIVPRPLSCQAADGEVEVSYKSKIKACNPELVAPAKLFAKDVATLLGGNMKVTTKGKGAITLSLLESLGEEEYTLDILPSTGITIKGGTPRAVFYGLQSLLQIVAAAPNSDGVITLAAVKIADKAPF